MTLRDARSVAAGTPLASAVMDDETGITRRAASYRRGLRDCALSYPAGILRFGLVAAWLRRHHACVTASTAAEITTAVSAGISPARITIGPIPHPVQVPAAVHVGVGRFVVSTNEHIATLAACTDRRTCVIVDLGADIMALVPAILAQRHLRIVGVQHRIAANDTDPLGLQAIGTAVGEMSRLRRAHGVLLTHVCLDGLDLGDWSENRRVLRHLAAALNEAAGAACEHHRYPRPVVSVTPSPASFLLQLLPSRC